MEILCNQIYQDRDSNEKYRILYVNAIDKEVTMIKLCGARLPYPVDLSEVEYEIESGLLTLIIEHTTSVNIEKLTKAQKREIENEWAIIKNFVQNIPYCYYGTERIKFLTYVTQELGLNRVKVQRILHKFWAGGSVKTALIPDYHSRGNRTELGKRGDKVLGRAPAKEDPLNNRKALKPKDMSNIKIAIKRYYNKNSTRTLMDVHKQMCKDFYTDKKTNKLLLTYPTYRQFYYYALKFRNEVTRIGEKAYARNHRGLTGSSEKEAFCPGEKYQIDATIADIYLVATFNNKQVIGRPVLYFVTDIYSRIITGFYVGVEGPSWIGAMMALYYTFTNKVQLCEKYGVKITEEQWPCHGLPVSILSDNGELISKNSNNVVEELGIYLQNTSAWRPDLKGIVEQSFRLLNLSTLSTPGKIQPDFRERGAKDYRLDAKLNIKEFTKIVINYILLYNQRALKKFPQESDDILQAGIRPIPIDIWNWGTINRGGTLRQMDDESIRIALLPKIEDVTITEQGLSYNKNFYICDTIIEKKWMQKARHGDTHKCTIKIDPRDTEHILLCLDNGSFEWCERTDASKGKFVNWFYEDLLTLEIIQARMQAGMKTKMLQNDIDYRNNVEEIIKEAVNNQKVTFLEAEIVKNKVKNISVSRSIEKQLKRDEEKFTPKVQKSDNNEVWIENEESYSEAFLNSMDQEE
ncbi:DDE-type integrase/transposase/recombinase [Anaerocolumna sp. AGMB13025]|uniref:DDE-type integrase/transposase/recombinase n=1 Tax=Anaerocolumna sp. AGMB13025 TaxID=3039116 RepID=UPI00241C619F|nr:DDE-type integrase/transposase/recombinase [Anaerocolumna sp. AGMB13025]WFR57142.1 DDE-type integrase/transposase/recombinase [Anaerocolumna sp. AGMB13025]